MSKGTIGVFDSGLGGLLVLRSLVKHLSQYDYLYLGDTKRVPYGNRSPETIHQFLGEAADFLFSNGCDLVVVACNTASASALRKIQQEYMPRKYPDKKILGVIIPAAEVAASGKRIGVLATQATVDSGTFVRELKKLNPNASVFQEAAPLLVPLIENNALEESEQFLRQYLKPLLAENIDTLVLGCTHYGILKAQIEKIVGDKVRIISQDDILPAKLSEYLKCHQEIETKLSKNGTQTLLVTDINPAHEEIARKWFGEKAELKKVDLT